MVCCQMRALTFLHVFSQMSSIPLVWTIPPADELRPLISQPAPQIPVIDTWVWYRFANLVNTRRVHYEASFYGPINSLLTSIFLIDRRMMIKPQALIRPSVDAPNHTDTTSDNRSTQAYHSDDSDDEAGDVSLDSQGDFVMGRLDLGHGEGTELNLENMRLTVLEQKSGNDRLISRSSKLALL